MLWCQRYRNLGNMKWPAQGVTQNSHSLSLRPLFRCQLVCKWSVVDLYQASYPAEGGNASEFWRNWRTSSYKPKNDWSFVTSVRCLSPHIASIICVETLRGPGAMKCLRKSARLVNSSHLFRSNITPASYNKVRICLAWWIYWSGVHDIWQYRINTPG